MNLHSIVDLAGAAATGILYLLIALSVVQVAIMVERGIVFYRTRSSRRRLEGVARLLDRGNIDEARQKLRNPESLPEAVLAAGAARISEGPEAVEEVVRSELADRRINLESRLSFLATLGNNAPFIGLLGTVLGIMHAFANLTGASGQISTDVMSGISEALIATGVGLMVALPAVVGFNLFQRLIKGRVVAADRLSGLLVAALRGRAHRDGQKPAALQRAA